MKEDIALSNLGTVALHATKVPTNRLTSWLSFVVSTASLSLSHWYPGSGAVLDCIDS